MSASRTVEEPGMGTLEVWDLPTDQDTLEALLRRVFMCYWDRIHFGVLIQGAVLEIRAPRAPHFGMLDGYLTIDFEEWHMHVCIGATAGPPGNPTDEQVARIRPTARAELYRALRGPGCTPATWGLRLVNGANEQQLTVLLPNPFLTPDQHIRAEPDWDQLDAWDDLRATFLGLEPDPLDRTGTDLHHG